MIDDINLVLLNTLAYVRAKPPACTTMYGLSTCNQLKHSLDTTCLEAKHEACVEPFPFYVTYISLMLRSVSLDAA